MNDESLSCLGTPTASDALPLVEQLIENGQPQFGVFAGVKRINYLDYHSHLISQKPVSNRRKHLKVNQFAFIQIIHPPYRICMALASIKLASSAFVYIYHEPTQTLEVVEALNPLLHKVTLQGDHQQGVMRFSHRNLELQLQIDPQQVTVDLHSRWFWLTAQLKRAKQPLAVCTPSGRRGWTFTQKEPLQVVAGELCIQQASKLYRRVSGETKQRFAFTDQTLANLDWTLGYMRHETNWYWSCINHQLADGRQLLLNLAMGVNETGVAENACWIDGEIHYLPPVMFRRREPDPKAPATVNPQWQISHQQLGWSKVAIELSFTPISVYQKTDNFGLIASIFEQWLGFYTGEICLGTEVIHLDRVMGIAEDHFAKW